MRLKRVISIIAAVGLFFTGSNLSVYAQQYDGEECIPYYMTLCNICENNYNDGSVCPHHVGEIYGAVICEPYESKICNICDNKYYSSDCPHLESNYLMYYGNYNSISTNIDMDNTAQFESDNEYSEMTIEEYIQNESYLSDICNRAYIMIYGGGYLAGYPVAAEMLEHFMNNTGEDYTINFARMSDEYDYAYSNKIDQIDEALEAAEEFNRSTWFINNSPYQNSDVPQNYHNYYNDWNKDDKNKVMGIVSQSELWYLHYAGIARQYSVNGLVEIKASWDRGERYDTGADIYYTY